MPKLGAHETSEVVEVEGYAGRFGELAKYTVGFETYTADADLSPLFRACPTTAASARTGGSCSRDA